MALQRLPCETIDKRLPKHQNIKKLKLHQRLNGVNANICTCIPVNIKESVFEEKKHSQSYLIKYENLMIFCCFQSKWVLEKKFTDSSTK